MNTIHSFYGKRGCRRRISTAFGIIGLYFIGTGCSPSMFFGGNVDQDVSQLENYRKINTACAGMNLSTSMLDIPTFRSILQCFNGNGALEPVDRLINGPNGLSDTELQPIVDAVNQYILGNQDRLYQIDRTYTTLDKAGLIDESFRQAGRVLENRNFISYSLALLKNGYFGSSRQDILKSIERISKKLSYKTWSEIFDLGLKVSKSKAYSELIEKLKTERLFARNDLREIIANLYQYLSSKHSYSCDGTPVDIKRDLIRTIDGGQFFTTLDTLLGKKEDEIHDRVPKLTATLEAILNRDKIDLDQRPIYQLVSAFYDLNREIPCMKETQKIPNGALHLIRELSQLPSGQSPTEYILKDLPITLSTVSPFCTLPENLAVYFPTLTQLARNGAMEPLSEVIQTFYKAEAPWRGCDDKSESKGTYHPLATFFVNFFGESENTFQYLLPTLIELNDRHVWNDLLLLISLLNDSDQTKIQDTLRFFVVPSEESGGKSIVDVAIDSITVKDYLPLFHFVSSFQPFIHSPEEIISPALSVFRKSFYANEVHPFLDLVKDFTSDTQNQGALYQTLFLISDRTEFSDSIELFATMAKDGRLKELTEAVVKLFHPFVERNSNKYPIKDGVAPALVSKVRHSFSEKDLSKFTFNSSHAQNVAEECDAIQLDFSLAETHDIRFSQQIDLLLRCRNGGNSDNDLSKSLRFLESHSTEEGDTYLQFFINRMKQFVENNEDSSRALSNTDVNFLFKEWEKAYDDGRFFRVLNAFHYWSNGLPAPTPSPSISPSPTPSNDSPSEPTPEPSPEASSLPEFNITATAGPALKNFLSITNTVISESRNDLQGLESFLVQIIKNRQFPSLLGDLDDLLNYEIPTEKETPNPSDRIFDSKLKERVKKWVERKECSSLLSIQSQNREELIQKRVDEIFQEAKFNMTNWELMESDTPHAFNSFRKPRQKWDFEGKTGFKPFFEPILKKITDPKQSVSDRWLLDSVLNFSKYFTRSDNSKDPLRHFKPESLLKWLYERSIDFRPISYLYPGEKAPRVRLVNTLDALEILLINVDFDAPVPISKNLGLDYLAVIGDAWGDISDPKQWPPEIQKKYPDPSQRPMTLAQAVENITNRQTETGFENLSDLTDKYVGLPNLPECFQDVTDANEPKERHALCENRGPNDPPQEDPKKCGAQYYMPPEQVEDFQVRLYNLWQVVQTLKDNAPGSNVGFNGGLEVLRDLFYEIHYSTPPGDRDPTAGDKNNLTFVLKMVRLGLFRQIGRTLIQFEPNDPALNDFFTTFVRTAESPQMRNTMISLLGKDSKHDLIWRFLNVLFQTLDKGTPETLKNLKQFGLYSLASLNRIQNWQPSHFKQDEDLLNLILSGMGGALEKYKDFLSDSKQEVLFKDLLESKSISKVFRAAYDQLKPEDLDKRSSDRSQRLNELFTTFLKDEKGNLKSTRINNAMEILKTIYGNEQTRTHWKTFLTQLDEFNQSSSYKNLKVQEAVRPILNFLELRTPELSQDEMSLSRKISFYGAQLLEKGDIDQLFLLSSNDPEAFNHAIQTFGNYLGETEQKGLRDFLKMIRRSLSEPAH